MVRSQKVAVDYAHRVVLLKLNKSEQTLLTGLWNPHSPVNNVVEMSKTTLLTGLCGFHSPVNNVAPASMWIS